MLEFMLSTNSFSWWIITICFLFTFVIPVYRKLDFSKISHEEIQELKELGLESGVKFKNQEYYSLCQELLHSWQWQVKMKLNFSFESSGLITINEHILNRFDTADQKWVSTLLSKDLDFEEKKRVMASTTNEQYQTLCKIIKQDIQHES